MAQIAARQLIPLLRRMAVQLRAGVDTRVVLKKEAEASSGAKQQYLQRINDDIAAGEDLTTAVRNCDGYFPPLVCDMVEVGDHTGRMDMVLENLAEHYEQKVAVRRRFMSMMMMPFIEFCIAIMVVTGLILILGFVGDPTSEMQMSVFGLSGVEGAVKFLLYVGVVIGGIVFGVYALFQGKFGPAPILFAMKIPMLGKVFELTAMARLIWTLSMTLDAGLDAGKAVKLAMRSTQNYLYMSKAEAVDEKIVKNQAMCDAFRAAGVFPADFLAALDAAEFSGTHAESLDFLAADYQQRAESAMNALAIASGTGMMFLLFGLIIGMIFYLAMQYINMLSNLANGL